MSVQSLGIVETSSVECLDSYTLNYSEFVMRIVVHSSNFRIGFVVRDLLSHAFRKGRIVLHFYAVLVYNQLVA